MSISLYYDAKRDMVLSESEQQVLNIIIEKYNKAFSLKEDGESFSVYRYNLNEPESVFSGSIGLPDDPEKASVATLYWMECLSELRRYLSNCAWEVSLDDYDIPWNESEGYHAYHYL